MKEPLRVAAGVIVLERRILVARRHPSDSLAGFWEFPGGKIEPGESPEVCLVREFREEFEMQIEVGAFIGISRFPYKDRQGELHAYWGIPRTLPEALTAHDAALWVTASRLSAYRMSPADGPIAQAVLKQLTAPDGEAAGLALAPAAGLRPRK